MNAFLRLGRALLAGLILSAPLSALAAPAVTVEHPYARAVPPVARNSGAFMLIRNDSDQARRVIAARSDVSRVTELHTHIHDHGVMRMRRVDFIEVPAHGSVALKPGGYHVMLIGLKHPLRPGDPVHIDLTLDDGSVLPVDLKAKKIGMPMKMGGMQHGMAMPMKH